MNDLTTKEGPKKNIKIIFMGTPEFAVASLEILIKNNYEVVAVVTAPDKPAGRGRQVQETAVKKYALKMGLKVLQPEKLKNENFLQALSSLKADLFIVVAFRMLPEVVWNMPPLGTFNLHASLLPQYRGAAPINHAIINGEKETGVTTFFLKHEIDTGDILFQQKTGIREDETAGELHDELMVAGAGLVLKTVMAIEKGEYSPLSQNMLATEGEIKHAPKIFKEDCRINWAQPAKTIYNLVRGLSPYPGAYTELQLTNGATLALKIFFGLPVFAQEDGLPGSVDSDGKTYINIACQDGWLKLTDIQLQGKNRMKTEAFLRGFNIRSVERAL